MSCTEWKMVAVSNADQKFDRRDQQAEKRPRHQLTTIPVMVVRLMAGLCCRTIEAGATF